MTKDEVIELLEENKEPRGIAYWERVGFPGKTYGIGLTMLKQLGKKVGKDHELALELWESGIYDLQILATIIDDPKKVTQNQVRKQVKHVSFWMLSHAYCSTLLAKLPFMKELAEEWIESENHIERRCGYALLYHIAKDNKDLPDSYFENYISVIVSTIQSEENFVKDAMNNAMLMIGQRSKNLNDQCIRGVQKYGKLDIDYGDNSCQPADVIGNLTSDRIQNKILK